MPLGTIPRRRLQAKGTSVINRRVSVENVVLAEDLSTKDNRSSSRLEVHHLRNRRRRVAYALLGLLVASAGVLFLLTQTTFVAHASLYGQVGEVDQSRVSALDQAIASFFNDNPLQRIHFVFSSDELVSYLQSHDHSEIKSLVSTTDTSLGNVQMTFKVREPVASWSSNSTHRFVDASGVVFSENYYTKPSIAIIDQSGLSENRDLSVVASARLLRFIGLASGILKADGYTVQQIILPANTTREVDIKLSSGIILKMTVDRSVGEQCEDADRALAYFHHHKTKVHYVDVRVSRSAYYK